MLCVEVSTDIGTALEQGWEKKRQAKPASWSAVGKHLCYLAACSCMKVRSGLEWCHLDANNPRIWAPNPKMSFIWSEMPLEQKSVD